MRACARVAVVLALSLLAACESRTPPPTPAPGGGSGESITGRERIGWDQQAASAAELTSFRYAIYVDGARSELTASCASTAGAAGFACTAPLPPMGTGAHTLELAAYILDGGPIESPRSAPLRVTVTGAAAPERSGDWVGGEAGTTTDGLVLGVERLAEGFVDPADASFAPDGRLFVAERAGRILVARGEPWMPAPALIATELAPDGGVLALALDPAFAETRMVFVLTASMSRGGRAFRVSRYRELGGRLAQRAIVFETPAPPRPSGTMRFGPDGRLYLALGSTGSPSSSSYMGKLLRLNADGTTPRDRRSASPIVWSGHVMPRAAAWDPAGVSLWVADGNGDDAEWVTAVAGSAVAATWALPPSEPATSLAFHHQDLLLASPAARHILRVRFAQGDPQRVLWTESLLKDRAGSIRVIAPGADGIYFLTDTTLGRLTLTRTDVR